MAANVRALAAKCVFAVIDKGRSLADELPAFQAKVEGKDKGLLQELCYGVLRYLPELENDARQHIKKPLVAKQRVIHFLILVGIYQLKYTRIPDHAALSETVSAAKPLKHDYLKSLVNGILRNFQRKENTLTENLPDAVKFNHPSWFIKKIQAGYPDNWQEILLANQERPPMWLRVNQQHNTVAQYLTLLEEAKIDVDLIDEFSGAIKLIQATDVNKLPGFELGHVSVQDGAAQQAALLLNCQENDIVLDCCAAPGGKTCHILEIAPKIQSMTAIDIEENRLVRVKENLTRLNLTAKVIAADASKPEEWWDNQQFDRILLDAPCSGTGVIRRHPDIKWLRKASDIEVLTELQQQILKNSWSLLKPGGTLLYATCSILPEENCEQIQRFISKNNDAELIAIENTQQKIGWQILPNEQSMDGFYYAKLKKKNNE
ncbi:16S rRNA (cytosine(967)-C(5))-methyltransferase RsmB [Colwelliaceae bacterium 6441]